MKSSYKPLGNYIQQVDLRNINLDDLPLMGLSVSKVFFPTIANLIGTDMSTYKVVYKNQFTYIADTSRRGDKIAIALNGKFDKMLVSQAYTPFEVFRKDELDPEYLMMWFRRPEFDRYARFKSHGSAREIFDWQDMCDTLLPIPPINKQHEIVKEYNIIQNRINLNQQLIKKLEETAQAIYKQWFVDFEFPDENGKPYKSNGGEMLWCEELGKEIPKGWKNGYLPNLIEIKYGKAYSHLNEGDIPLFGSGGLMRKVDKPIYSKPSVLIPRKGTLTNIMFVQSPFWCVDTMFYSIFKNEINGYYAYYILKQFDFEALDQGSAVPSMTTALLNDIQIVLPKPHILKIFDSTINKIESSKLHQEKENQKLTELKELLLSKLAAVES